MPPAGVVVHLDVLKYLGLGILPVFEGNRPRAALL